MRRAGTILLAMLAGVGLLNAQRAGRLRPPRTIECPRDKLTSFTGRVASYSRTDERINIVIHTDSETTEKFTLRYSKGADPAQWFLMKAEPFKPDDWKVIESAKGRLRPGIRATIWVCEGGANPVVDWQTPPE